jgi:hypothetical protein
VNGAGNLVVFDYSGAKEKWQSMHMHWLFSLTCYHQKNPYSLPFIVEVLEKVARHKVYSFWIIFHVTTRFTLFQRITSATTIVAQMTSWKKCLKIIIMYIYSNNNLVKLHYLNVLINLCDWRYVSWTTSILVFQIFIIITIPCGDFKWIVMLILSLISL